MSDADRARALRRRHMHERQAVVFGVLLATLAVVGLGAAAVYTGSLSLPFVEEEFSASPTPTPVVRSYPCPPEGARPVSYGKITVNVYNSTKTGGLAATTLASFADRGFKEGKTANQPEFEGTALVTFGRKGVAAAYTVAAHIPGAQMLLDARKDATVDVTVGTEYTALIPVDKVKLDAKEPLVAPKGCTPLADLKPTETGTPKPTKSASSD
ncbi:LytR C-terminal domain-containing protein [Cellulomonas sp.]|uniref:LytR C-terminal domain-containing protein n=1 Tax=Cellulomonas sp. TaxID=40001 RepID=UPI002587F65C|nr:LytR C-terminal domain-containing protein [Cellulomonas sp.]MCR6688891.1 LytR C-terminal domain-containing protein [Cellulomonas sp.]